METEIEKAIAEFKLKAREALYEQCIEFERRTGLTPTSIEVSMTEVTRHGDRIRKLAVGHVTLSLGSF